MRSSNSQPLLSWRYFLNNGSSVCNCELILIENTQKKKAIRKQKMPKNYGLVWLAMALIKLVSSCFLLNIAKS